MEQDSSQVISAIFFGIILMTLMSGFIVMMVLFHRQRQFKNRRKIDHLTAEYEKTILSVEKEIREQTLVYVGQELHDNIGQILSLTKLTLRHTDPERIMEAKSLVQQAIKEVRNLSKSINLEWVNEVNLKEFVSNELDKIASLGFCETDLSSNVEDIQLDNNKKLVLIRMIQECLNNSIKHASPSLISITIESQSDEIAIGIKDNGIGFNVNRVSGGQGLGNLESRIKAIGGQIQISSVPNEGTHIQLYCPIRSIAASFH